MFIYYIKPEDKTVVAVLRDTAFDAIALINKHARNIGGEAFVDYLLNDEYVGIARCHDLDKFDADFGKELAKRRALRAHHRDLNEKVRKYVRALDETKATLERNLAKFESNERDLQKLLDEKR